MLCVKLNAVKLSSFINFNSTQNHYMRVLINTNPSTSIVITNKSTTKNILIHINRKQKQLNKKEKQENLKKQ